MVRRPDPDARRDLIQEYTEKYKVPPPPLADLASDAASIARVLTARAEFPRGTDSTGWFLRVDGWLGLLPDGQVRRGSRVPGRPRWTRHQDQQRTRRTVAIGS